MTHRTKIIVLRKKELLLFSIIAVLSFLLLAFFIYFLRNQKEISTELPSTSTYAPGVYTASVVLNDTAMNVSVSLDQNNINSISLVHLDENSGVKNEENSHQVGRD